MVCYYFERLYLILTNDVIKTEHGGHHGHSHGGLSRPNTTLSQLNTDDNENNSFMYQNQEKPQIKKAASAHGHSHDSGHMNMRGAFLHVLSDALGSVIVVISALVRYFFFLSI